MDARDFIGVAGEANDMFAFPQPAEWYDTDQGNKVSLARKVQESARRYAVLRSPTPRFPEERGQDVPFGVYDVDTGSKAGFRRTIESSRVFYAAAFSGTPRFNAKEGLTEAPDVMYNTHEHMTISRALAETPLTYSVMRTRVSRLSRKPHSSAPDVEYDVRAGKYKPLAETARESGLKYTSMTNRSRSTRGWSVAQGGLGPGYYGYLPTIWDLRKAPTSTQPTSSFASKSKRFTRPKR